MKKLILCSILLTSMALLKAQWIEQSSGVQAQFSGIYFENSLQGWICGSASSSYIIHTSNGGELWETQFDSAVPYLYDIHFSDDLNGWAVGGNHPPIAESIVLHTEDGGLSWLREYEEAMDILYGVHFTTPDTGWIAGAYLHYTSDGGNSWSAVSLGGGFGHYDVYFANQNNGWTVGHFGATLYGSIHHTVDGGLNWLEQESGAEYSLYGVFFLNDSVGWAVGGGQTILHTVNGGDLWDIQHSATHQEGIFFDVYFIDSLTGWVVGSDGQIWHTDNGGQNWIVQHTGIESSLKGVYFSDLNQGWACGGGSVILHTDNGGIVGIDKHVNDTLYGRNIINIEAYPNPFSNLITISYELHQPSTVQLTIFNHFGQQVDFIQQNQFHGKQQVTWDASDQPAGMYYFRLEAGEQVSTGKLLLLR